MSDPITPEGGWRVRILDLSGGAEDGISEEVGGFPTIEEANAFARAYVRDSVELCRAPEMAPHAVLAAWHAYGEDAVVPEAEGGWRSAPELEGFARNPASESARDWRALDPRRLLGEDEA